MPGVVPTCLIVLQTVAEATPTHEGVMVVAPKLMILTWIVFLIVVWILHRTTWKPILNALELRENRIRRALDEAAKAEKKAAEVQSQNSILIEQAREESRKIIEAARQLASESARMMEERAQTQARNLAEETTRAIDLAVVKAREELRRETTELTLALAERVIGENMDSSRNRVLIEKQLEAREN